MPESTAHNARDDRKGGYPSGDATLDPPIAPRGPAPGAQRIYDDRRGSFKPLRDPYGRGLMRVRAYHPESGNILTAVVTDMLAEGQACSWRVIPDGLLEAVIIRQGEWVVTDVDA